MTTLDMSSLIHFPVAPLHDHSKVHHITAKDVGCHQHETRINICQS
jgi:hypothetical protein